MVLSSQEGIFSEQLDQLLILKWLAATTSAKWLVD
jgi:hypothetical protein